LGGILILAARQHLPERALFPDRFSPPIPPQQLLGSLGEHPSHFSPLAFDPGDFHRLIGSGFVPHPGDDGSFGPLLDRDSLRPSDRATSNRGGVIGHGMGESVSEVSICGMEGQELQHRCVEILDVLGLGLVPASAVSLLRLA
jgi:hypothetical protein